MSDSGLTTGSPQSVTYYLCCSEWSRSRAEMCQQRNMHQDVLNTTSATGRDRTPEGETQSSTSRLICQLRQQHTTRTVATLRLMSAALTRGSRDPVLHQQAHATAGIVPPLLELACSRAGQGQLVQEREPVSVQAAEATVEHALRRGNGNSHRCAAGRQVCMPNAERPKCSTHLRPLPTPRPRLSGSSRQCWWPAPPCARREGAPGTPAAARCGEKARWGPGQAGEWADGCRQVAAGPAVSHDQSTPQIHCPGGCIAWRNLVRQPSE